MEIFIDSANVIEIKKWMDQGIIGGVTTNPSVLLKDKVYDVESGVKDIAKMIGDLPLSVEVTTDNLEEMIIEARSFASWSKNIVVKIPVINQYGQPCLGVINELNRLGIKVNVTGIMSFNQAVMAAKAGGAYISVFSGRVSDEGNDAPALIEKSVEFCERWGMGKVLVGSIRGTIDIHNAIAAGAHIVTIPPPFLTKMVDHKYTRETVKEFVDNAKSALTEIEKISGKVNEIFPEGKEMPK